MIANRPGWRVALPMWMWLVAFGVQAQPPGEKATPEDTCVLELHLPAGATVTVDGRDYGNQRELSFSSLSQGQTYTVKLQARFQDGGKQDHKILIRGGRRIVCPIASPNASRPELVPQTGHSDNLTAVAFSPDGSHILTGGYDNTVILWDRETGRQLRSFQHGDTVTSVGFYPNGRDVFACSDGRPGCLTWGAETGQVIDDFPESLECFICSADGSRVVFAVMDRVVVLNRGDGKLVGKFSLGESSWVRATAFSPDGTKIVVAGESAKSDEGTIMLGDLSNGAAKWQYAGPFAEVRAVAFDAEGSRIITGGGLPKYRSPGEVTVWDAEDGKPRLKLEGHEGIVTHVAFSPDGRSVLTCAKGDKAILWDAATGAQIRQIGDSRTQPQCAVLSPDGKYVLTGHYERKAVLWDTATGRQMRTFGGRSTPVYAVAVSPDGQRVLSASDKTVNVWDAASGVRLKALRGHGSPVKGLAFGDRPNRAISGSWDKTAVIWDLDRGEPAIRLEGAGELGVAYAGHQILAAARHSLQSLDPESGQSSTIAPLTLPLRRLGLTSDGKRALLLLGSYDQPGELALLNVENGNVLVRFASPLGDAYAATISSDGALVAAAVSRPKVEQSGRLLLWKTSDPSQSPRELAGSPAPSPLAFSPDGKWLVTYRSESNAPGELALWNLESGKKARLFEGHQHPVRSVAFHANGKELLTGGGTYPSSGELVLWDTESGKKIWEFSGHQDCVNAVAYAADGSRIASGGGRYDHAELFVWDRLSGQRTKSLLDGQGPSISHLAFSPDGRQIVSSDQARSTTLWDAASGANLRSWPGIRENIGAVAFSRDGRYVATGNDLSRDKPLELLLWDAASGSMLRRFSGPSADVEQIAFSPDGERLLAALDLNDSSPNRSSKIAARAILWETGSGRQLREFEGPWDSTTRAAAFSPDGRRVVVESWSLRDASTGTIVSSAQGHRSTIWAIALSRDNAFLVTGGMDGRVVLWDTATGNQVRMLSHGPGKAKTVGISPDNALVWAGFDDGRTIAWRLTTGEQAYQVGGHTNEVECLAVSPDGRKLATASLDRRIFLWEAATGRELQSTPDTGLPSVHSLAFSPDGRFLLAGCWQNQIVLFDANNLAELKRFTTRGQKVFAVAFSPDGRKIAGSSIDIKGSGEGWVTLWDVEAGTELVTISSVASKSVAFTSDGSKLVTTGHNNAEIKTWDAQNGASLRTFYTGMQSIPCAALASDGETLYVGTSRNAAAAWSLQSSDRVRLFRGPGRVYSTAISPDGRLIATGADNGDVMVCDSATGSCLRCFLGHAASVFSVRFFPHSERLATASRDGTVRIWDLATGDELIRLLTLNDENDWLAITPEGLFDGSEAARSGVMFRTGRTRNVVPVDRFFQDFYHPNLLSDILRGDRPVPKGQFAAQMAPSVRIASGPQTGPIRTREATFEAVIVDQGGGIKGPWLLHNGVQVLVPGEVSKEGNGVRRKFTVPLVEGENRLEVRAASQDGSWESEPAVLVLNYQAPLDPPHLYLVTVGISRYHAATMDLKFAAADAQAMADVFRERGPTLYGAGKVHITQVIDREATKAGITKLLAHVARTARPQDTLVLFLAGHGMMVGQRYYFITHEFKQTPGKLEEDIRQQGLAGDEVDEALRAVPALKRVVIYDTCHSGGTIAVARTARDPFAFRGALERMSRASGSFAIAASAAGAAAHEVSQLRHGVLTYVLLAGLGAVKEGPLADQPAKFEKEVIDVRDWFGYAQDKVPPLTKLFIGEEQMIGFSGHGSSFPILPAK